MVGVELSRSNTDVLSVLLSFSVAVAVSVGSGVDETGVGTVLKIGLGVTEMVKFGVVTLSGLGEQAVNITITSTILILFLMSCLQCGLTMT